jgi:hypothetical protein
MTYCNPHSILRIDFIFGNVRFGRHKHFQNTFQHPQFLINLENTVQKQFNI